MNKTNTIGEALKKKPNTVLKNKPCSTHFIVLPDYSKGGKLCPKCKCKFLVLTGN